jgi:uncharacterized protein YkwD
MNPVLSNDFSTTRRHRAAVIAIALTLAIVALGATMVRPAAARAAGFATQERSMVAAINHYRHQHHLAALQINARMSRAANWMGNDMASRGYFSHVDSLSRDPFRRMSAFGVSSNAWRGENLAAGFESVTTSFHQWRTSPEHNANMLNGRYRAIGITLVHRADSPYHWYWVTDFSSRA